MRKERVSIYQFDSGSAKPEVVRITPPTRAKSKTFVEKAWMQSKEII